jgi:hypothetical protein
MKYFFIVKLIVFVALAKAQQPFIRKQTDSICKTIDKDVQLKKKIFAQEDFMEKVTDEGGELTVYYKNTLVHRIKEWVGLSYGVIIRNYYFINKELLFVKEEEYLYEADEAGNIHKKKLSKKPGFLGKYYFLKSKLIDEESLGHNRFEDNEHHDAEKEYLASSKRHLSLFYKK